MCRRFFGSNYRGRIAGYPNEPLPDPGMRNYRTGLFYNVEHYHLERNHQGIENEIIESENEILVHSQKGKGEIVKKERLGGLLNYYHRKSA